MDVARSLDATPFMMLLAASQILAARLSRQQDFLVGVATAGRDEFGVRSAHWVFHQHDACASAAVLMT